MPAAKNPSPRLGRYIVKAYGEESVSAFVPPPLPPNPPLRLEALQRLLEQANQSLGRLDGLASVLPNLPLFIYAYVRKEAVLSSQIEGTKSSLSDLLLFENDEAPGVPLNDVQEVSNYVAALNHGLARLRGGFPLSLRLIREIHEILLSKGRGSDKQPGEFRQSQNWIGGTRPGTAAFVPPPPELVLDCMGALELFLHDERADLPVLIKAGLVHVQFETIHPFLDGNGRLGRLLITFARFRPLFSETSKNRTKQLSVDSAAKPGSTNPSIAADRTADLAAVSPRSAPAPRASRGTARRT